MNEAEAGGDALEAEHEGHGETMRPGRPEQQLAVPAEVDLHAVQVTAEAGLPAGTASETPFRPHALEDLVQPLVASDDIFPGAATALRTAGGRDLEHQGRDRASLLPRQTLQPVPPAGPDLGQEGQREQLEGIDLIPDHAPGQSFGAVVLS